MATIYCHSCGMQPGTVRPERRLTCDVCEAAYVKADEMDAREDIDEPEPDSGPMLWLAAGVVVMCLSGSVAILLGVPTVLALIRAVLGWVL